MIQFIQIYSIYVMSTFVEVLKNISKSIIFYPLATYTHLYTLLYKHTYHLYILDVFRTYSSYKGRAAQNHFSVLKPIVSVLPFCSRSVDSACAAAWKTSLEEECISMDSITSLCAGNLSKSQPQLSLPSPAPMLTLLMNSDRAGLEAELLPPPLTKKSTS